MDWDWLKSLALPLGVALYAFLLRWEPRRNRKPPAPGPSSQELGDKRPLLRSESPDTDGRNIPGNRRFLEGPPIDR